MIDLPPSAVSHAGLDLHPNLRRAALMVLSLYYEQGSGKKRDNHAPTKGTVTAEELAAMKEAKRATRKRSFAMSQEDDPAFGARVAGRDYRAVMEAIKGAGELPHKAVVGVVIGGMPIEEWADEAGIEQTVAFENLSAGLQQAHKWSCCRQGD